MLVLLGIRNAIATDHDIIDKLRVCIPTEKGRNIKPTLAQRLVYAGIALILSYFLLDNLLRSQKNQYIYLCFY